MASLANQRVTEFVQPQASRAFRGTANLPRSSRAERDSFPEAYPLLRIEQEPGRACEKDQRRDEQPAAIRSMFLETSRATPTPQQEQQPAPGREIFSTGVVSDNRMDPGSCPKSWPLETCRSQAFLLRVGHARRQTSTSNAEAHSCGPSHTVRQGRRH